MKNIFLVIVCFSGLFLFSQEEEIDFKNCNTNETDKNCFKENLYNYLLQNLDLETLEAASKETKTDTLYISSRISFNQEGKVLINRSQISSSNKIIQDKLSPLIKDFPSVKVVVDFNAHDLNISKYEIFYFLLNKETRILTQLKDVNYEDFPFRNSGSFQSPVYKGCNKKDGNIELKKCMSIKIAKHVSKNFNKKLARTIDLEGKVKILVQFIVDKEGKIFGVKTRSSYTILSNEAKRVIEEIPDLESPGYLDGKPILIPYGFPISFEIENSKKERKRLKNKS